MKCYWNRCEEEAEFNLKGGLGISYCPFHAVYVSILLGDYKVAFKIYDIIKLREKGTVVEECQKM